MQAGAISMAWRHAPCSRHTLAPSTAESIAFVVRLIDGKSWSNEAICIYRKLPW